MENAQINTDALNTALSKMLSTEIISATHQIEQLYGGTVGNVNLITGTAKTFNNADIPFKVVLKIQKKWERQGDPNSWRREYDLYASGLGASFSKSLYWPICYHVEFADDETKLWMEYIQGVSGEDLTTEMLEVAAYELGCYQGMLYTDKPDYLCSLTNLGEVNAVESYYRHWKPKNVEYKYIRNEDCKIPKPLRDMLIDIDNRVDAIFENIRKLPIVFCHRDFWVENIIYTTNNIALIDWDTTGWGYLGEDIAQLITDETDPTLWEEYRRKLIPAYLKGFGKYAGTETIDESVIYDMILVKMGYVCVFYIMNEELSAGEHYPNMGSLEKLYDVFYVPTSTGRKIRPVDVENL